MQSACLLSDMEAFKAANPGCTLGDFVRWYSPRDWLEEEKDDQGNVTRKGRGVHNEFAHLFVPFQKYTYYYYLSGVIYYFIILFYLFINVVILKKIKKNIMGFYFLCFMGGAG